MLPSRLAESPHVHRPSALALLLSLAAACRPAPAPPAPEVLVHATVGEPAATVLTSALEARGIARVRRTAAPGEAELLWLRDPTEVVALGAAVAEGAAPEAPGVPERFLDARRRFAPLCGRARVLVVSPRARLPFAPSRLRDLADPRLAGLQALAPPGGAENLAAMAALSLAQGYAGLSRFLALLAAARPRLAASDAEARRLVAVGEAAVALTSSEEAAAGAASAAGLEVVYPDQGGRGTVLLPTAVALTPPGARSEPARRAAAFLAGPEAERLLVARAPGHIPLRDGVPVPVGVQAAASLRTARLDWDRLAAEKVRIAPLLGQWK